jgi:two-component system OmpR family sensor kinase
MSLRARVLVLAIALLAVGLTASNILVIASLRGPLESQVDGQLRAAAVLFARLPPALFTPLGTGRQVPAGLPGNLVDGLDIVLLDENGGVEQTLLPPGSVSAPALPTLDAGAVSAREQTPFTVSSVDGAHTWRALAVPRSATRGTVVVAAPLDQVDAIVARLRLTCVLIGVALLVLLGLAGWFAVRAGLRPLRTIERTTAAIAAGDLSSRVPDLAAANTEVGRLTTALNGMLGQIESALRARASSEARMRRFVADASHELRTPLFGISGSAELYRMGAVSEPADVDRTMARIEDEALRLGGLVNDLLLLAQLDEHADDGVGSGTLALDLAPMDLRTLAVDALHDLRALDPTRQARLTGPAGSDLAAAPVLGDEARLRQVVSNLIGNVTTHTPAGTPVRIGVGTLGSRAMLEVADNGPGLTEAETLHVFDRFYRADAARGRLAGGGAGLGLAIVWSLVTAHGGSVEVSTGPGEGAVFRVLLPVLSAQG